MAVTLYGSRATGKAKPRSDFDLATHGITDHYRPGRLALDLEDLNIPQKCDVQACESMNQRSLQRHIDEVGIEIYRREEGYKTDGLEHAEGTVFTGIYQRRGNLCKLRGNGAEG